LTDDYDAMVDRLINDMTVHPTKYLTVSDIVQYLLPDHVEANRRVMIEAQAHLKISPAKFESAMNKRRRELAADEKALFKEELRLAAAELLREHEAAVEGMLGGHAKNARECVSLFMAHKEVTVTFGGDCIINGQAVLASAIEADILLTAEAAGYTLAKNRIMSPTAIKLAFDEYLDEASERRKREIMKKLMVCTDGRNPAQVLQTFREVVAERAFKEPEFAMRALMKVIWQVKRKLLGLPIKQHHMIVLQGPTDTGKTAMSMLLLKAVKELSAISSADQVVDDRNFKLRSCYLVFLDELAKSDKADVNKLKNLITGEDVTARVLYTHRTQTTKINMTLIGTADRRVSDAIYDQAGMRRFVEVHPKERAAIDPYWDEIVAFDWLGLWQSVDPHAEDPLMSVFKAELQEKQEQMRALSTVEAWVRQFEFAARDPIMARAWRKHSEGKFVEFTARNLYEHSFVQYEDRFHRGSRGTPIPTWSTALQGLIANHKAPGWSHRDVQNVSVFRLDLTNAEPATPERSSANNLIVVRSNDRKAG
jgi:Virulence-associated protein E